jgi:hypothetical protein
VSADPRWWSLARAATVRLLGHANESVATAVLAQWTCEQPTGKGHWPPTRNNPGNNAAGWAKALGYSYTVQTPNPQPGNPIVTYASPGIGAAAYADGLRKFGRYSSAMARARAGDGLGFGQAVCSAGYGTSKTCFTNIYRQLTGQGPTQGSGGGQPLPDPPPGGGGSSSTGGGGSSSTTTSGGSISRILPSPNASLASTSSGPCAGRDPVSPGGVGPFGVFSILVGNAVFPIPADRLADPCACPPGYNRVVFDPKTGGLFGTNYVPIDQLKSNQANACAASNIKTGNVGLQQATDGATDIAGGLAAGLGALIAPLGDVLRSTALFGGLLLVAILGLYLVTREG